MDEKEIKRTTDSRKKAEWAKSASNLQNQRRRFTIIFKILNGKL